MVAESRVRAEFLRFFDRPENRALWACFDLGGVFSASYVLSEALAYPPGSRVLTVGDYSLRDVRLLGFLGYRVDVADLARIPGLTDRERFIEVDLNDAEAIRHRLPGPYELVVLGNVLEHVPNDALALAGIAAKLADGGRLVLDVPLINPFARFPQDKPDYHIQAYTPRILARLTGLCGLEADRRVFRGVLLNWWYTLPFRGMVWLGRRLLGERRTFCAIERLARWLIARGERSVAFRALCPWSWAYGCLFTLRRAPARESMAEVNRREFLARPGDGRR